MTSTDELATLCVHAGAGDDPYGSPHVPIYNTTTFTFTDTSALAEAAAGPGRVPLYTRYGSNPSLFALERHLAALEAGERALAFASGMAALSATALALGEGGVVCLGNVYGGTLSLVEAHLPRLGIAAETLAPDDEDALERALAAGAALVILETPANPTLEVADIAAVAARVHHHGARLAVDNTFATPVNQRPLALGADVVIHSATKYLGGHSDLTAGTVIGDAALLGAIEPWRLTLGQAPAPETASLLSRSLRTLEVRVERHNANAQRIAEAMSEHPAVARVHYPGLADAPDHALARRQMSGFGGMLSLTLAGEAEAATGVVDRLRLFANAPSLGGVESLATQPSMTSHAGLSAQSRRTRGIADSMIRLSVGIESAGNLVDDLERALAGHPAAV